MKSKLALVQVMLLTFDILLNMSHTTITKEQTCQKTVTGWWHFCSDEILVYLNIKDKIGGKGKVVEIESKFGKRKYNRGHVEGQWVFGGVEGEWTHILGHCRRQICRHYLGTLKSGLNPKPPLTAIVGRPTDPYLGRDTIT
jgi:hypothetical protein